MQLPPDKFHALQVANAEKVTRQIGLIAHEVTLFVSLFGLFAIALFGPGAGLPSDRLVTTTTLLMIASVAAALGLLVTYVVAQLTLGRLLSDLSAPPAWMTFLPAILPLFSAALILLAAHHLCLAHQPPAA